MGPKRVNPSTPAIKRPRVQKSDVKKSELKDKPQSKKDGSTSAISTSAELNKHTTQLFEALQFQMALRDKQTNIATKMAIGANALKMDNSKVWIPAAPSDAYKGNLLKWWAQLPYPSVPIGTAYCDTQSFRDVKAIFNLLMLTGARSQLNEIDPTDGLRPIDVALDLQGAILTDTPPEMGLDFSPTAISSPLYHHCVNQLYTWYKKMVSKTPLTSLDWSHPVSGQTVLHWACTTAKLEARAEPFVRLLLSHVGFVDPSHHCFTTRPITEPSTIVSYLEFARAQRSIYKSVHLTASISKTNVLPVREIISIVVDYV